MKIIQRGTKLFIRHWFKWYVMAEDDEPWVAVDEMVRIKFPQNKINEKEAK